MANGVMRVGHAIFNHAAKDLETRGLPMLNPFRLRNLANKETPRQTGMSNIATRRAGDSWGS